MNPAIIGNSTSADLFSNNTQYEDYYDGSFEWYLDAEGLLNEILPELLPSKFFSIFTPVCIGILTLIGVVGNVTVIFVTVTTQRIIKHPVHSMLVLNLAVADILYLLVSAPYQAVRLTAIGLSWTYSSTLCPFLHFVTIQTLSVSIFTMCSLAILRFLALMAPFQVNKSCISPTKKGAGFIIIPLVWLVGSILAVPNAVYYRVYENSFDDDKSTKYYECSSDGSKDKKFYLISSTVITFVLPLLLLIFLHYYIRKEISKQKYLGGVGRNEEMKVTIMILFLVLAFLISWLPYNVFIIFEISESFSGIANISMMRNFNMAAHLISYAHACVNPIIYTFGAPGFRQSSYRMFCSVKSIKLCVFLCRGCKKHLVKLGTNKAAKKGLKLRLSQQHKRLRRASTSAMTSDQTSSTILVTSQQHSDMKSCNLNSADLRINQISDLTVTSDFSLMTSSQPSNESAFCRSLNIRLELKPDLTMVANLVPDGTFTTLSHYSFGNARSDVYANDNDNSNMRSAESLI